MRLPIDPEFCARLVPAGLVAAAGYLSASITFAWVASFGLLDYPWLARLRSGFGFAAALLPSDLSFSASGQLPWVGPSGSGWSMTLIPLLGAGAVVLAGLVMERSALALGLRLPLSCAITALASTIALAICLSGPPLRQGYAEVITWVMSILVISAIVAWTAPPIGVADTAEAIEPQLADAMTERPETISIPQLLPRHQVLLRVSALLGQLVFDVERIRSKNSASEEESVARLALFIGPFDQLSAQLALGGADSEARHVIGCLARIGEDLREVSAPSVGVGARMAFAQLVSDTREIREDRALMEALRGALKRSEAADPALGTTLFSPITPAS